MGGEEILNISSYYKNSAMAVNSLIKRPLKAVMVMFLILSLTLPTVAMAAGTWIVTGALNQARVQHKATLLSGGKVLVVGCFSQYE
jgi:hypothetical protein